MRFPNLFSHSIFRAPFPRPFSPSIFTESAILDTLLHSLNFLHFFSNFPNFNCLRFTFLVYFRLPRPWPLHYRAAGAEQEESESDGHGRVVRGGVRAHQGDDGRGGRRTARQPLHRERGRQLRTIQLRQRAEQRDRAAEREDRAGRPQILARSQPIGWFVGSVRLNSKWMFLIATYYNRRWRVSSVRNRM